MAKTPAEYQRDYRERKKKAQMAQPDQSAEYLRRPFSEFFRLADSEHVEGWEEAAETLAYAGVRLPDFEDEEWREFDEFGLDAAGIEKRGAIGKAEFVAGALQDALGVLTAKINAFKRQEIEARINEIEASDLSDPDEKKRALAEIVRLNRIRDQLGKQVRLSFPAFEVKG